MDDYSNGKDNLLMKTKALLIIQVQRANELLTST